ncbi:MAG: hypothetical protein ACP5D7_12345 [Limnospira sp.]
MGFTVATQPTKTQNVAVKKPGFLESASVPIQNFGKNPVSNINPVECPEKNGLDIRTAWESIPKLTAQII